MAGLTMRLGVLSERGQSDENKSIIGTEDSEPRADILTTQTIICKLSIIILKHFRSDFRTISEQLYQFCELSSDDRKIISDPALNRQLAFPWDWVVTTKPALVKVFEFK